MLTDLQYGYTSIGNGKVVFSLFRRKTSNLAAIDLSSCSAKLLELSHGPQGYRIESYAVEPIPDGAMQEQQINDVEAIGLALQRLIKRSRTKAKIAAMAVAGSAVITKVIHMNKNLSESELSTQIQVEADRYIPFPLEEVYLDFQVLGENKKNPDLVDVLLAASRSENVDARVEAAHIGGMQAKVMDIEAYAIERAFGLIADRITHGDKDKTIAVVDIGSTMTTLSVLHNRETIYTREQIFGGKQLTEEIQRRYGLSYEEAGIAKKQGGLPDDYVKDVLEPFKDGVVQQVSRSLQFFFSSTEHNSVDHIVLAGGTSSIPGLVAKVEEKLSVPCTMANPFMNMSLAPRVSVPALNADAPSLMICCGLALRSFV